MRSESGVSEGLGSSISGPSFSRGLPDRKEGKEGYLKG